MNPKVLLYDIETSYIIGGAWGLHEQDLVTVLQDWQILCFAYKWLDEKKIHVLGQDDYPDYKQGKLNDLNLIKELHRLFSEADVVVAHNGNNFDQKKVQARMMVHGLNPPVPYAQIDTLKEMKKVAAHSSNRLADLNKALGLSHKLDAGGIDTWTGCMNGDPKSWKQMKKYNKGDIVALEELYLLERPWIKSHPAMNVITGRPDACPKCGASEMIAKATYRATNSNLYRYYGCKSCGGVVKGRVAEENIKPKYVN